MWRNILIALLIATVMAASGCSGGSASGSQSNQGAPPPNQGPAPPPGNATSVVVMPATVTLAPGGTQTFTAAVKGLVNTNVTWTVQEATGGTVNGEGSYTAPIATGFYHVVATSVADAAFNGSATITVTTSSARFTPTGDMPNAHGLHTATMLADGRVLIAGGATNALDPLCLDGMASAELYDSSVGSFTSTGSMTSPRYSHTATSLLNGEVLVTGGFGSVSDCEDLGTPVLSSAELYNPASASFKATGGMFVARRGHTATLLPNGKVLVAGGTDQSGVAATTPELYDPAAGLFTRTGNMAIPRSEHTATLLANGKVLILGGFDTTDPKAQAVTAASEIYDPITGSFTGTGSMTTARAGHTATLLIDGRVLIAGGVTNAAMGWQLFPVRKCTTQPPARFRPLVEWGRRALRIQPLCSPMATCWSPEEVIPLPNSTNRLPVRSAPLAAWKLDAGGTQRRCC